MGGFEEREKVIVERRALRKERFEVEIEGTLVSDAFMEETSDCVYVGEGFDLGEGFLGAEFDGELLLGMLVGVGRWW